MSPWSHTYTYFICGAFTYTAKANSAVLPSSITLKNETKTMTIYSINANDKGTYNVEITGGLYNKWNKALLKSASIKFKV